MGVVPFGSFKVERDKLKCATFPTPEGCVPSFEEYASYVAGLTVNGKSVIDKTQSEDQIKKLFFTHLWNENNLSGYKSTLTIQPTEPSGTPGDDGGVKPVTPHGLDSNAGDLDVKTDTGDSKLSAAQNSTTEDSESSTTSNENYLHLANQVSLWLFGYELVFLVL